MIRQDTSITGIEINKQEHVISLFADDIMMYLKNPTNSLHLTQTLEKFSLYSGYKVNILKTQILMFNCTPNKKLKEWKINWEAKSLKYLGINITKDLSKSYQSNYEVHPLGLNDRINVIKTNILPRMLYLLCFVSAYKCFISSIF